MFQHIPWFLKSVDEADGYFNINVGKGRKEMLDKIYDKVRAEPSNFSFLYCLELA